MPFVQELLHFHPGLEFLESHDEFQRKYALTVIARIFFKVNVSRTGKLSLREVYSSNLIQEFMHVDEETDINRVVEYFSYEHFYVLYCRFFELDADKDSKLTRDDLLKYGEHSLSEALVDRSAPQEWKGNKYPHLSSCRNQSVCLSVLTCDVDVCLFACLFA